MRIFGLMILLFSAQAYSCPQLSGAYTCTYQDGSMETVTVQQDTKGATTTYIYNGSTLPADNQIYPLVDDANIQGGTFRTWCEDDRVLKGQILGKYWSNGEFIGDLTMNLEFLLDGGDLRQTSVGGTVNGGANFPIASDVTCARN